MWIFELTLHGFRDDQEIKELLETIKEDSDYFSCSNMFEGISLPGLNEECQADHSSICASEKNSSQFQIDDEQYFRDSVSDDGKTQYIFF